MSENQPEPQPQESAEPQAKSDPWEDPESARKEIEKLRKESGNYRTKLREVEPLAAKARLLEDANKTDLEKYQSRLADAERERDEARVEITRFRLATQYKLSEDDLDFLGSGTEQEMADRAKRLAARIAATSEPEPRSTFDLGNRGTPAAAGNSMDQLIRRSVGR